ncbi:MAG TPA: FAD-dependent oxidoreductase [Gaiellaceae bacterium]|nr:FAD-dependent oxidoreductase [Gaiellaceae bacterium]
MVGGGLTGLWAALEALGSHPGRSVVLLEGERIAFGASGRNGGFCDSSLTHGLSNGLSRFPGEIVRLEELGRENLDRIVAAIDHHGIDARYEAVGVLDVATREHEVAELEEHAEELRRFGQDAEWLDREAVQAEIASPTYLGGVWQKTGVAVLDPARLAWGLAAAAESLGAVVHEATPVLDISADGDGVRLDTLAGRIRARRVVLATSAFPPLVRAIRRYVVPVYDYVLVTEPLSAGQRAAVGWKNRQGAADSGNQFHYYRLTSDDRILWGGYDAIYNFRNGLGPHLDQRQETFRMLAENFFATFPQLEGIRFTHRWGGAIDTCSRFCMTFGRALGGRAVYVVGFTGLGVGASRFGARVALDLAAGRESELTRLQLVRTRPLPFPPEPLRWAGITLTRKELARADRVGERGLWLKTLDRLGLGFDS